MSSRLIKRDGIANRPAEDYSQKNQIQREEHLRLGKSLFLAIIGGGIVILAILLNFSPENSQEDLPNETMVKKTPDLKAKSKVTVTKNTAINENQIIIPSFDIVRAAPTGNTVMAGKAAPSSKVEIYDHNKKIGEVFADDRGEWVFIPKTPLKTGNRKLSLKMTTSSGIIKKSASNIIIILPKRGSNIAGLKTEQPSQPLTIKVPTSPRGKLEVLQKPNGKIFISLTVDAVDYDDTGKLDISGTAPSNAIINLYLNKEFLGRSISNKRGLWHQTPKRKIKHGKYKLRADHIDKNGKVKSRVEVVFARAMPLTGIAPGTLIVVESGRSLWRIARSTYGSGLRYTTIYEANKNQIKNPDLIFPGQVFALPPAK